MPILAFGYYTVHGTGTDDSFVDIQTNEFAYYSLAPAIWILIVLTFLLAVRYHKIVDPSYSTIKIWALVPRFTGLTAIHLLPNEETVFFTFSPLILTAVLLMWRWRRIQRIIPAFLSGMLAAASANLLVMAAAFPTDMPMVALLVESAVVAAVLVLPLCLIRAMIRKRITWMRFFWGFVIGTLAPLVPLVIGVSFLGAPPTFFLYPFAFISLATVPFIALIKWNSWVRDLATGDLFNIQTAVE